MFRGRRVRSSRRACVEPRPTSGGGGAPKTPRKTSNNLQKYFLTVHVKRTGTLVACYIKCEHLVRVLPRPIVHYRRQCAARCAPASLGDIFREENCLGNGTPDRDDR
jgi:hypothetical protein